MAVKYVVVWGEVGKSQRLIPVDDEFYAASAEEAKRQAREGLLVRSNTTKLLPQEVMSISEEKFQAMLEGTTPLLTFNQGTDREFEMLEVTP